MSKVNTIVICKENYDSQEEFENAIKKVVMFLIENDYIMTVRYDEPSLGIVVIDYESANSKYGTPYPYWLTAEEFEKTIYE
jgi:hypothetical protein